MSFENNTVVWASAGTGKTRKLVEVYLELLERGLDPMRIAAVTFTERAAADMRDRIRTALETKQGEWARTISILTAAPISTIHAFCAMLLRDNGIRMGIDPSFSMLDEQQSLDLARESAREIIRQEIRGGNDDAAAIIAVRHTNERTEGQRARRGSQRIRIVVLSGGHRASIKAVPCRQLGAGVYRASELH